MSCCGRKKKKQDKYPPKPTPSTSINATPPTIQSNNQAHPKSKITYQANNYNSVPMNDQSVFLITSKAPETQQNYNERSENYAQENNTANQSKLLTNKQLLTYDLDREDGISIIPIINTFHYDTMLDHCFLYRYYPIDDINQEQAIQEQDSFRKQTSDVHHSSSNFFLQPVTQIQKKEIGNHQGDQNSLVISQSNQGNDQNVSKHHSTNQQINQNSSFILKSKQF